MASYHEFTVVRLTPPDAASLLALLRANDATIGVQHLPGSSAYVLKKATAWTAPQIAAAQNLLETAPVASEQRSAQAASDAMGVFDKAIVLTLLDLVNAVRAKLVPPLGAITPQQLFTAIRDKAGSLE